MGWQDTQTLTPDEGGERARWWCLSGARSSGAGATMIWLLGVMSFLMCAGAAVLLYAHYWDPMTSLTRVLTLSAVLVVMWLGYGTFAHWGWSSREVRGLLLSVTCLISVICLREALPGLHLWFLGLIFLGGIMLVLALQPGRVAVIVLALACLGELVLVWLGMNTARDVASWALLWTCVLSVLMIWGISGGWCAVTYRSGYSTFSVISPVTFVLYLLVYQAMILYPQYLRPARLSGSIAAGQWVGMMLIWLIPMSFLLRVQCARARRTNRPIFAWPFILYYSVTILSLPVGLLLLEHHMPVLGVCVLFGYAACIVCYGAAYRMSYFVVLGSLLAFISAVGVPLGIGISFIWSAAVMLALAVAFFAGALVLSRKRDNLLVEPSGGAAVPMGHTLVRPRPATQAVLIRQDSAADRTRADGMPRTLDSASPVGAPGITASFKAPYVPPVQVPSMPRPEQTGHQNEFRQTEFRQTGSDHGRRAGSGHPVPPLPQTAQAAPMVPSAPRLPQAAPAMSMPQSPSRKTQASSREGSPHHSRMPYPQQQSPSDIASPDVSLRIPTPPGGGPGSRSGR